MPWQKQATTTADIVKSTTTKLTGDIAVLSQRKNQALSVFRRTADELAAVNQGLENSLETLGDLQSFIKAQTDAASQMISDNANVRNKILEIIGEN